jgi:hypothetical protein
MKNAFASAAPLAAVLLVLLLQPASALTPRDETDCSGGAGPCLLISNSPGGIGIQGVSQGGTSGAGVQGLRNGPGGAGVQAVHVGGVGLNAAGNPAIALYNTGTGRTLLEQGFGAAGQVFSVDSNGNAIFKGKVTGRHESVQSTAAGQPVTTFASTSTQPVLEDDGETTLLSGRGYVRFDARFASAMQSSRYLVFVTPQGPVTGSLYVSEKTPYGFALRETLPGRSSVAVDYRVVVQPFGVAQERLPNAPAP